MVKFFTALSCLIAISFSTYAQNILGKVIDESNTPIPYAYVVLFNKPDSTAITYTVTDTLGVFNLNSNKIDQTYIQVSSIGFETVYHTSKKENTIILKTSLLLLDEVVVTAKLSEQFDDRKSYKPNLTKISKYNSFLESLNSIPMLQVDINRKLSSIDGKEVKILINGVNASENDLAVLNPADVKSIDVYDQPPARFANLGLGAVVNIVTKRKIRGGSIGINLQDAVTNIYGNNIVGTSYNWNNSRLSFNYNNTLRRNNDQNTNELLNYTYNGVEYKKIKEGLPSSFNWDLNTFQIGYMNTKENKYQFNITSDVEINDRKTFNNQNVVNIDQSNYKAQNSLLDDYIKLTLDIYFNKIFNKKNELLVNVTGSYYDTDQKSSYTEKSNEQTIFNSFSNVESQKYSIISELQYIYSSSIGNISIGLRDFYGNSSQIVATSTTEHLNSYTNNLYGYASFTGSIAKKKLRYSLNLGINNHHFNSPELDSKYSYTYFAPKMNISYSLSQNSQIYANYRWDVATPSISMLGQNPILLDNNYIFQGNSNLTPYRYHYLLLGAYYSKNRFTAVVNLSFQHQNRPFMPYFTEKNNYVMRTFENMKMSDTYGAVAMLSWEPFAKQLLQFKVTGSYNYTDVKGLDYSWFHNNMRIIAEVGVNINKWSCKLFYQTSTSIINGQLMRELPAAALAEVYYRPVKGMSVGLGWRYPFMDYVEGTSTHNSSIVQSSSTITTGDYTNMLYINFTYYFSLGRDKKSNAKRINNKDGDSGILRN